MSPRPRPTLKDVIPATGWDIPNARAWSVIPRLRERQADRLEDRKTARREVGQQERQITSYLMTAAHSRADYIRRLRAAWDGEFALLAFLFAHPDCNAMKVLDERGEYFNIRSGNTWDLFFPGYYKSDRPPHFEREAGAQLVGRGFARDWYFNPRDFDRLRRHIEDESKGRWRYSGEADLLLTTAYIPSAGEITVDWSITIQGQLTDDGTRTPSLAQCIERISGDLESGAQDPSYGVGDLVGRVSSTSASATREFIIAVLAEMTAALGKTIGLP